jgi:hypothetical protein
MVAVLLREVGPDDRNVSEGHMSDVPSSVLRRHLIRDLVSYLFKKTHKAG